MYGESINTITILIYRVLPYPVILTPGHDLSKFSLALVTSSC